MTTETAAAILAACLLSLFLGWVSGRNVRARTLKNANDAGWYEGVRYQQRITAHSRNRLGQFSPKVCPQENIKADYALLRSRRGGIR